MIFIALGSNKDGPFGTPIQMVKSALTQIEKAGLVLKNISPFYQTEPWPPSDQALYINAMAEIETDLKPAALLKKLKQIERGMGRQLRARNAMREIDLDLIAYHDHVMEEADLIIPHPRLQERDFVLYPLADLQPDWQHPILKISIQDMLKKLPSNRTIEHLPS